MKIKINNVIVDAKLPKEFKVKWLKALRSGKYQQTKHTLHDGNGYCCLGVACNIAHPRLELGLNQVIDTENFKVSQIKNVPDILIGNAEKNKLVGKLAGMNDGGKNFATIANWIERYL